MAARAQPSQPSRVTKTAMKIKSNIDSIIEKMQRKQNYSPDRKDLEKCAKQLIDFINEEHEAVVAHQSYLKAAIIDLTEVPEMAPQMQRISFLTALRDASKNMDLFISCY
jgi:hypothetical protein